MIGLRLSHYEVLQKLGEGGMNLVYQARDTHLDRLVAIKVLPPEKVASPDIREVAKIDRPTWLGRFHPTVAT